MIYDYVIEKPPLDEDTLIHYGVKGMKWRNRKGRSLERKANFKRKLARIKDASMVTHRDANGKLVASHRDNGQAGSRSWQNSPKLTNKSLDTLRKKNNLQSSASNSHSGGTGATKAGIEAGRMRARLASSGNEGIYDSKGNLHIRKKKK